MSVVRSGFVQPGLCGGCRATSIIISLGRLRPSGDSMTMTSRTTVHCKLCRATFPLPTLADAERNRVVSSVRDGQHIQAIHLLRQVAELDLRDGKAVEMHITRTRGVCIRCCGP